jgi:hypothetical protein
MVNVNYRLYQIVNYNFFIYVDNVLADINYHKINLVVKLIVKLRIVSIALQEYVPYV